MRGPSPIQRPGLYASARASASAPPSSSIIAAFAAPSSSRVYHVSRSSFARHGRPSSSKMARSVAQIAEYSANGKQWLRAIVQHLALEAALGSADEAEGVAKTLMNAMLFGDDAEISYTLWKREHCINASALLAGSPLK